MRLLFGREFPFEDMLVMWDHLFAEGLRPELVDFVCIAMLLRIRWQCKSWGPRCWAVHIELLMMNCF